MTEDAFEGVRKFYEAWMKAMADSWERMLRDPMFVSAMGRTMTEAMDVKAAHEALFEKAMKGGSLPTRAEFEGLKKKVAALETKVEQSALRRKRGRR